MRTVKVPLKDGSYDIYIENGLLYRCGQIVRDVTKALKAVVITDSNIAKLYLNTVENSLKASDFDVNHIVIHAGEKSKSIGTLKRVYEELLNCSLTSSDVIIALGGGVTGDLAGFAAATILRGVPFVQIPTTLLAQVDSSVGGKVAINCKAGKNLIGAFYQPLAVIIDPAVLGGLNHRQVACGLGEVVKYGSIRDKALLEKWENGSSNLSSDYPEMIERCCSIKADIVSRDTFDKGERMLLNFGHTAGHAVEAAAGYGRYTHGEAVAIGMYAETMLGEELGQTERGTADKLRNILINAGLPYSIHNKFTKDEFTAAFLHDKKLRSGSMHLILIRELGNAFIYKMDSSDAASRLYNILQREDVQ